MTDYLSDAKTLKDAVTLAVNLAYIDPEGDVIPTYLADDLWARIEQEIDRHRQVVIAVSNLLPKVEDRNAVRASVGLAPYSSPLG